MKLAKSFLANRYFIFIQDRQDRQDEEKKANMNLIQKTAISEKSFLHGDITDKIIGISFEVMRELGMGFLESVYHKALRIALHMNGVQVQSEVVLPVSFRGIQVGYFKADLVVCQSIIVEVKATDNITGDHKAQVINYLSASGLAVGLILNFGRAKVQIARLEHPNHLSTPSCLSCIS